MRVRQRKVVDYAIFKLQYDEWEQWEWIGPSKDKAFVALRERYDDPTCFRVMRVTTERLPWPSPDKREGGT